MKYPHLVSLLIVVFLVTITVLFITDRYKIQTDKCYEAAEEDSNWAYAYNSSDWGYVDCSWEFIFSECMCRPYSCATLSCVRMPSFTFKLKEDIGNDK